MSNKRIEKRERENFAREEEIIELKKKNKENERKRAKRVTTQKSPT